MRVLPPVRSVLRSVHNRTTVQQCVLYVHQMYVHSYTTLRAGTVATGMERAIRTLHCTFFMGVISLFCSESGVGAVVTVQQLCATNVHQHGHNMVTFSFIFFFKVYE